MVDSIDDEPSGMSLLVKPLKTNWPLVAMICADIRTWNMNPNKKVLK